MTKITPINAGNFHLDGGAMFGVVPRVLWEKQCPPDELNRITMATRVLLIEDGGRKSLVDTGLGDYQDEQFAERFGVEDSVVSLGDKLTECGHDPSSITDVVLTHLHFDHAGGLVRKTNVGFELVFPAAKVWVQQQQWDWARRPSVKDRASYHHSYIGVLESSDRLALIDGDSQISENVRVSVCGGHTPGMQVVLIETEDGTCFYPADLIPMAAHVPLAWNMAYDNEPLITVAEKQRFLRQAAVENWRILFEHDASIESGFVQEVDGRFSLKD